jgi:hypothetical protein
MSGFCYDQWDKEMERGEIGAQLGRFDVCRGYYDCNL